jgi:predicted nucleotidyltransferase component of viral defense system
MPPITITAAHLARHTPTGAGSQGRDAALVDIAQDLLLRHLHIAGLLDTLVFKGGTALRKLYAGTPTHPATQTKIHSPSASPIRRRRHTAERSRLTVAEPRPIVRRPPRAVVAGRSRGPP